MTKKLIKLLFVFCIVLSLAGCSTSEESMQDKLTSIINKAINQKLPSAKDNNCTKDYYNYYLPTEIGRLSSDELSNTFVIQGNTSTLSLDVASIVADAVLANTDDTKVRNIGSFADPVYSREGRFTSSNQIVKPYSISIAKLDEDGYFAMIQTNEFIFISTITDGSIYDTIYEMMILLRTVDVATKDVILDFASENIISYQTYIISLFNDVQPESGQVIDYVNKWDEDKTFIRIDNSEKYQEDKETWEEYYD